MQKRTGYRRDLAIMYDNAPALLLFVLLFPKNANVKDPTEGMHCKDHSGHNTRAHQWQNKKYRSTKPKPPQTTSVILQDHINITKKERKKNEINILFEIL